MPVAGKPIGMVQPTIHVLSDTFSTQDSQIQDFPESEELFSIVPEDRRVVTLFSDNEGIYAFGDTLYLNIQMSWYPDISKYG